MATKPTDPVGTAVPPEREGTTVAVKATDWLTDEVVDDGVTLVVVAPLVTVCAFGGVVLLLAEKFESPL
jgi:hypothetical protein